MLARGVRNVIYNYTDAQRKVRSATSNDAWGPSPALMHEIADLTDNAVAYAEIMPIIWKRLNDHGKNWRHVYKSLVLLDHLIKYGNERVTHQCKENIFAIQTLKDFQYIEDQKDQGYNVREKAKQLVALLKDDERLRNERRKAQEGRDRYVRQAMGVGPNGSTTYGRSTMRRNSMEGSDPYGGASYLPSGNVDQSSNSYRSTSYNDSLHSAPNRDFVQPASQEEEQLQLQIAMAESQREADDQERRRRNDDVKLKIALERSVNEASPSSNTGQLFDFNTNSHQLDSSLFDPHQNSASYLPATTTTSNIGWTTTNNRPSTHLGFTQATNDPWSFDSNSRGTTNTVTNDPWQTSSTSQVNPWSQNQTTTINNDNALSVNISDPWGVGGIGSQPKPALSQPTTTTTIDNELNDFFGASATIPSSHDQQTSSNPWNNISSSSSTTVNTNLSTGGNLLYPTIPSGNNLNPISTSPIPTSSTATCKTPESFLGESFSNLVNLNQLVTDPKNTNPFGANPSRSQNPFSNATKAPTLDQLTSSNPTMNFPGGSGLPPPLIPSTYNSNTTNMATYNSTNPFM